MIPIFIIGGISPRPKRLDSNPRPCPACGLYQAYLTRIDHYLTLFFVPLFRVKKGTPFIRCDRCERSVEDFPAEPRRGPHKEKLVCGSCAKALNNEFKYCPFCGNKV